MNEVTGGGAFTRQNISDINENFLEASLPFTPGRVLFCWPSYGQTIRGIQTGSRTKPYTDIYAALGAASAGKNDVILVVGNGAASGSVRISSTLAWSKDATHLIGYTAPSYNPRARLATNSGTTAFAAFVVVTGFGCMFRNFSLFNDYAIAAQITWDDQAGRNYYGGVQFGGMGDATSAADADSRVVRLGGSSAAGENLFENCTIGIDTIARSVANASVEFTGNSKRNVFRNCLFPVRATAATPVVIKSSGTNPLETFQLFDRPIFANQQTGGSGTALTGAATLAASGNGQVILRYPTRLNITDWGTNATSLAQIFVDGPATGATDDIGRGAVAIAT